MDNTQSEIHAARAMAEDYLPARTLTVPRDAAKTINFVAHGKELALTRLDDDDLRPEHRAGTAHFTTLDSFCDHVNRFKSEVTAVFVDDERKKPMLRSVLDYHGSGDADPNFTDHRGIYDFPLSEEWETWTKNDAKPMEMVEFAQFLEDRIVDIDILEGDVPDTLADFVNKLGGKKRIATPQQLVDIAANLSVAENSTLKRAQNLSSGESQIEFNSEHETSVQGRQIIMPSMFLLSIPVFRRGDYYRILARLRYRKVGPAVVFFYELVRPDKSIDHAIYLAAEKVKAETEVPVFYGSPEA